jgi:N-succinyldiaminopimelate aminotransferase
MGGSVYSALGQRLANYKGEVYPLHIGDTWMEPAEGCRMEDLSVRDHPGMHRYASVQGRKGLLEAVAERVAERTQVPVGDHEVLITAGATGGLGAVVGGLVSPGDEVLIAAPYWPLFAGIVRSWHGVPVPTPLLGCVEDAASAVEAFAQRCSPRTVAVYLSTPNNPTGQVIPGDWLEAIADWARHAGLWLISDEVYEDFQYVGTHRYLRQFAPERTFSAYSFSKGFGMAGNRVGYVVGPSDPLGQMRKVGVHTYYSTTTASQITAERCLRGPGEAWVANARAHYAKLGRAAATRLGVPAPEGSTFLFLDVAERLDERGLLGFLEDCADRGLFIAPGPSFGAYPTHVRVCFTSAPPDVVLRGVEVLAEHLGR